MYESICLFSMYRISEATRNVPRLRCTSHSHNQGKQNIMSGKSSSILFQKSVKDNTEELQDFLRDLKGWEKEIRETDKKLSNQNNKSSSEDQAAPPVRCKNKLDSTSPNPSTRTRCDNTKQKKKSKVNRKVEERISSLDYKAWEKFDVDKPLESSEGEKMEQKKSQSTSRGSQGPKANKKERANIMKEEGNQLYSKGCLEEAVAKYSQGMALDPTNTLLPANRAMAYIKLKKYTAAEADCNRCLKLDSSYIKGYLRRGTARLSLDKTDLACKDFQKVIELEPWNKEAKKELEKLKCMPSIEGREVDMTQNNNSRPSGGQESKIMSQGGKLSSDSSLTEGKRKSEQTPPHKTPQTTDDSNKCKKKEGPGKKLHIKEVNSQKTETPASSTECSEVTPVHKPPHLRSTKPLKRIPVREVRSRADLSREQVPQQPDTVKKQTIPVKSMPVLELKSDESSSKKVPSVPRTSHQFSQDWHRLSGHSHQAAEYLKIIPPAFFSSVDLEVNTLVDLVSGLGCEEVPPSLAAQHLLALSTSKGFSIHIMFLEADQRQVFLNVISKCQQVEPYSTKMKDLQASFS